MAVGNRARRSGLGARFFFGTLVIAVGVLFLVDKTGIAELDSLIEWWPSLIILYGVWRLIANRFRSLFWPVLLIAIGAFFQLGELGFNIDLSDYWPVALIAIGVVILMGGMRSRSRRRRNSQSGASTHTIIDLEASNISDTDDDTLQAVISSQDRVVTGEYHSGSVNIVMGNGTLDMRNAFITDKPATLEVSVVMGEVKIRVPADWDVRIANSAQMGEAKDTRPTPNIPGDPPDLIISGSVTMGSLQITD